MKLKQLFMAAAIIAGGAMITSCGGNKNSLEGEALNDDTIQSTDIDSGTATADTTNMSSPLDVTPDSTAIDAESQTASSGKGELNIKITPGKMKFKDYKGAEAFDGIMTITVTNLSDTPVSGKDYNISYKCKEDDGTSEDPQEEVVNLSEKGIDLGAGESGKITLKRLDAHKFYDFKIKRK